MHPAAQLSVMLQALRSIKNYKVNAVVANILETRMNQVLIVRCDKAGQPRIDTISRKASEPVIEKQLVAQITKLHAAHISSS